MPSPDPIDVHVGLRIRQRRVLLGMSMETLGAAAQTVLDGKAEAVAVSLGGDGALLATRDGCLRQAAPKVEVKSAAAPVTASSPA